MTCLINQHFVVRRPSSATYLNSERIVIWQQCLLSSICSNVWQSWCSTKPNASKNFCSKPTTSDKTRQTEFSRLALPVALGLFIHSSTYVMHSLEITYLWSIAQATPEQKTSLLGFVIVQLVILRAETRTEICLQVPSGSYQVDITSCTLLVYQGAHLIRRHS